MPNVGLLILDSVAFELGSCQNSSNAVHGECFALIYKQFA